MMYRLNDVESFYALKHPDQFVKGLLRTKQQEREEHQKRLQERKRIILEMIRQLENESLFKGEPIPEVLALRAELHKVNTRLQPDMFQEQHETINLFS